MSAVEPSASAAAGDRAGDDGVQGGAVEPGRVGAAGSTGPGPDTSEAAGGVIAAARGGAPVLAAEGVRVHLGERLAVDDATLSVRAGEFIGLIGPNGAGKTTLLRAVLGLVPLSAGRVLVNGRPLDRAARGGAAGGVGYVPQRHEFAWEFPISIADAVMAARTARLGWLRRPRAADRAAVDRALLRAGLAELRDRPVGELSGGQRQRVLVARALATDPSVLLLDEPFTGVDLPTQELLSVLFQRLVGEGLALVMTTHDLAHARAVCTRLCLLNTSVVAQGTPEELRDPALLLRAFGVAGADGSARLVAALGGAE
ncbi:anchored repeat-type ABC transporter ATP-binding subunit [Allonocardiopsis opalescens]|uniref:Manganese/iron transport system ATP-binding protein n=1 Tax=Allonocardiopsis opalescens TaxID=1144618 RepID=A0A2T0Q2Q2_9ACTN|nr:anchored repeat-type ABC transporter ATP-binding subunit [Allonocardiopsis opalescens]PRX97948.1 manganese/iron transport system ATP-binding protein [Allonocardiopsis opalescens]